MSSNPAGPATGDRSERRALISKLRFPEFRDAGQWNFQPLHSLAKRKTRRNVGEEVVRVLTNSAEYGVIDQRDFFEKDIATAGNRETYFVVEPGDYVYNPRISSTAPVGPLGKNKIGTGVVSPLYTVFRFDHDEDGFYEQFFRSSLWHRHMRLVSNSGARHDRMAISNDDLMEMPIPAPLPAERRKIADCLSSLDAVIAAEGERLAALRQHKKGLLQALFPAENQAVPRLRIPEFREEGEWEAATLGQISEVVRGGSPRPIEKYLTTAKNGLNWLKIGDVDKEAKFVTGTTEKVRPEALGMTRVVNPGDLILSNSMSFGRPYILEIETCIHDGWIAVTKVSEKVCRNYLYYQVSAPSSQAYFKANAAGSGVKNLNADIIKLLPVKLPKPAEQKRIADCLSSLDMLVEAQASRLVVLRQQKFGLMQQLFPSPDLASV